MATTEGRVSAVEQAVVHLRNWVDVSQNWTVATDLRLEAIKDKLDDIAQLIRDSHSGNGATPPA